MQVVIRKYSGNGAAELFDVLEEHAAELLDLMRPVQGLVSYTLARSGDGGFSVTVCQDKAGIEQSIQKAADWIAKNAVDTQAAAPQISVGDVVVHLK